MSNTAVGRSSRSADFHMKLRIAALGAVALGVVLLAAAAFALSYEGIHQIALRAGVSPGLAKLYPLIFDAMLVVAGTAALALRGAGWWARCYAWATLLLMLVAVAAGNVIHTTGTTLPAQPTKAAMAVIPWVLLLMAFGLLLTMLHYFRRTRSTAATAASAAAASGNAGADVNGEPLPTATLAAASAKVHELPRVDLDTLLGPREVPHVAGTGQNAGHQADPASYGEETGYVHPDSYLDERDYSPHEDTGGPEGYAEQAGEGTHLAGEGATTVESPPTSAATSPTAAEPPATGTETPPTSAAPAANAAEPSATGTNSPAASAETPATDAEPAATDAEPAGAPESPATDAEPPATGAEPTATSAEPPAAIPEPPATAATPPATGAEPAAATPESLATDAETPPFSTDTPAASAATTAAPAKAPAGAAPTGAANGQASGGDGAAAETPTAPDATAGADRSGDGVAPEAASAEGSTLQRIRSTPTRPEE